MNKGELSQNGEAAGNSAAGGEDMTSTSRKGYWGSRGEQTSSVAPVNRQHQGLQLADYLTKLSTVKMSNMIQCRLKS